MLKKGVFSQIRKLADNMSHEHKGALQY